MLITGTIAKADPPDFRDQYGNQYQNITIQTITGPVLGRKASKTPYAVQDIGRQVEWECTQQTSSRGPYNKFTKPQDPQYAQPQGQQGVQQAAGRPNAASKDDCLNRQSAAKSACHRYHRLPEATTREVIELAKTILYFIETGDNLADVPEMLPAGGQPNPDYVGDNPPPPTDGNIPF